MYFTALWLEVPPKLFLCVSCVSPTTSGVGKLLCGTARFSSSKLKPGRPYALPRQLADADACAVRGAAQRFLFTSNVNQNAASYFGTTTFMCDNFALARHFVVSGVRSLFVLVLAFFGASAAYVFYVLMRHRISAYRSPLRNLPGPEKAHWYKGNFVDVEEPDSMRLQEEWVRTYGHVLKFHSFFGVCFPFFSLSNSLNRIQFAVTKTLSH